MPSLYTKQFFYYQVVLRLEIMTSPAPALLSGRHFELVIKLEEVPA